VFQISGKLIFTMETGLEEFNREESDFERRLSILLNSHVEVVEKKYVQGIDEDDENTRRRKRRANDKKRFVIFLDA